MSGEPKRPAPLGRTERGAGDDAGESVEFVVRVRGAVAVKLARLVDGLEALAVRALEALAVRAAAPSDSGHGSGAREEPASPQAAGTDELLDAEGVADLLGVARRRVLALYRQGKLRAVEGVTNGLRFWRSHVLEDWRARSMTVQEKLERSARRRRNGA